MNIMITRPSDSPFHKGQVVSEGMYAEIVYFVWSEGGEVPLGVATAAETDVVPEIVTRWLEDGHERGILQNR